MNDNTGASDSPSPRSDNPQHSPSSILCDELLFYIAQTGRNVDGLLLPSETQTGCGQSILDLSWDGRLSDVGGDLFCLVW